MTSQDLAARIARLEAIREIEELRYRYFRAVDGKDYDYFRECFVSGPASLSYGPMGTFHSADEVVAAFRGAYLEQQDGAYLVQHMHHAVHPTIDVLSPDEAVGQWTLRFRDINLRQRTESVMSGAYRDRYVKVDGRWRVAQQDFSVLWMLIKPLPDEAAVHGLAP